jgi:uncharacterized membrane protein (UPF0127 family)
MERVINRTRGTVLADQAEAARSWWARGKGLLGRKGLPVGGGLIIEPCSSIHTWFMAFPIDVAFVAADGRVVRTAQALRPWRLGPLARKVRYVVELPAGALAQSGTVPDDYLDILPAEIPQSSPAPVGAGASAHRAP